MRSNLCHISFKTRGYPHWVTRRTRAAHLLEALARRAGYPGAAGADPEAERRLKRITRWFLRCPNVHPGSYNEARGE